MWYVPTFTLLDIIVFFVLYKIIMVRYKKNEKEEEERWKKCNEEMKNIMDDIATQCEKDLTELQKKTDERRRITGGKNEPSDELEKTRRIRSENINTHIAKRTCEMCLSLNASRKS